MSIRQRTVNSISNVPLQDENLDNTHQTENSTESTRNETSVEPNTNSTENTQQKALKISEFSYSEIFTEQVQL